MRKNNSERPAKDRFAEVVIKAFLVNSRRQAHRRERKSPSSDASAWMTLEKRLLNTFWLRENNVASFPRFTAMQR